MKQGRPQLMRLTLQTYAIGNAGRSVHSCCLKVNAPTQLPSQHAEGHEGSAAGSKTETEAGG